jgi:mono/diheme cytochrome c family protein
MKLRGAMLLGLLALVCVVGLASVSALVVALNLRGETTLQESAKVSTPEQVAKGAYLALAGNCATCHTARGGAPYAGGRGIETPFGIVYAGNLTPDAATGLGDWTAAEFWRALHHGRSRDGRLLYPAFPYPNYTQVSREDADALYAYLRTVPAVASANKPHALRFPYNSTAALAVWRALFFSPGSHAVQAGRSAEWNRGAYLVTGLGHCAACHSPRNMFGATIESLEYEGGLIPAQNWYAPSLGSPEEAGVADWPVEQVVALLKTGRTARGSVQGPMADVVFRSTQFLSDADLHAMAVFLKDLPQHRLERAAGQPPKAPPTPHGAKLYEQHCAACHGDQGQGAAGAYPPLAGNRAVTMDDATNLVRIVVSGGFPPATAGNPKPYGMPPFGPHLSDEEIAAVITHIRGAWGNRASALSSLGVLRAR